MGCTQSTITTAIGTESQDTKPPVVTPKSSVNEEIHSRQQQQQQQPTATGLQQQQQPNTLPSNASNFQQHQQQPLGTKGTVSSVAATTTTSAAAAPAKKVISAVLPKASPIGGGKKITIPWKAGGGGGSHHPNGKNASATAAQSQQPPPPLAARPRTDTWDVNLLARTSPTGNHNNNNNNNTSWENNHYNEPTTATSIGSNSTMDNRNNNKNIDNNESLFIPDFSNQQQQQILPTTTSTSRQQQHQQQQSSLPTSTSIALTPVSFQQQQQQYQLQQQQLVQLQWKMIWETQSNNLIDPADVPSVIDSLLDKIVNRFSPAQVTFIQRKIRLAVNRLYDTNTNAYYYNTIIQNNMYNSQYINQDHHNNQNHLNISTAATTGTHLTTTGNNTSTSRGGPTSTLKKAVFGSGGGGGGGGGGGNSNVSTALQPSMNVEKVIAEAKMVIEKYHLLTEAIVRQILPKFIVQLPSYQQQQQQPSPNTTASSAATAIYLAGTTTNAITLMLALSSTSNVCHLRDRTAFAAMASAQSASLEMDVNKKIMLLSAGSEEPTKMPKPSQVPIVEGRAEFPPGITVQAFCTILSIAYQSTDRDSKLQLLFYLCLVPDVLTEFVTTHPAGGVPTWLLEVGNHTVISLASLTHYHYYGHAFLPVPVPTESQQQQNQEHSTTMGGNGQTDETTTTTTTSQSSLYLKREFVASKSRRPISLPMARLQGIVQSLLDTERNNIKLNIARKKRMMQTNKTTTKGNVAPQQSSYNTATETSEKPPTSPTSFMRRNRIVGGGGGNNNNATSTGGNMEPLESMMAPLTSGSNGNTLNNSLHNRIRRKSSSAATNNSDVDGDSADYPPNQHYQQQQQQQARYECYSLFTVTEVMEKLLDVSDGQYHSHLNHVNNNDNFYGADSVYYYPADESTTASTSAFDQSREKFFTGTETYWRKKIATFNSNQKFMKDTASLASVSDLTLDDFSVWADYALDDLALNIVLHRLLGDGILPTPAMERDIVLRKWFDWQTSIRNRIAYNFGVSIMDGETTTTTNHNNNNAINSSMVMTDERPDTNVSNSNNNNNENLLFSESVQALLTSDSLRSLQSDRQQGNRGKSAKETAALSRVSDWNGVDNNHFSNKGGRRLPSIKGSFVWGGLGNVDGGGALGYGVLYCISKSWWDEWTAYTGWNFLDDKKSSFSNKNRIAKRKKRYSNPANDQVPKKQYSYGEKRPGALSTEDLLEHEHDSIVRGSMGSYEVMKDDLIRGEDYVLIPPAVWDSLYELYGGGPPLPRMIRLPSDEQPQQQQQQRPKFTSGPVSIDDISVNASGDDDDDDDANEVDAVMNVDDNSDEEGFSAKENSVIVEEVTINEVEIIHHNGFTIPKPMKIPDGLSVTLHPWIIHVHLCDPTQPYRRGETGPMSIRVMATPYQPLWRLFSETICRFSFQQYKAFDPSDGRGKARLWKKIDPATTKEPVTRYGPWNLLCKSRHAILPMMSATGYGVEAYDVQSIELIKNWKEYADNATLETGGLLNQDHLMLEFAIQNKNGELAWPREAAAKAGRVRRLAEEDRKFRCLLQGLSEDGTLLLKPPSLVGLEVDAMDSTGRWYTVRILEVDIVDDDTEEEVEEDGSGSGGKNNTAHSQQPMSRKKVKVFFKEHGGHTDWIDVESDRLATAGRFASQADQNGLTSSSPTSNTTNAAQSPTNETKSSKITVTARKTNANAEPAENAKLCTLPGFGACGLTNLGNTCYMNSALQCISYLPILRAYLLSAQYKITGDLNKDNVLGSGGKLLEETAELMRSMWSARMGEKSPSRFRASLGKMNPQFSGADQQDAQEFLNYIIDALHEDSYKDKKKPYAEALEDDWVKLNNLTRVGDEAWRRFMRRNRSIIADVAMGQALNTVTCPVCKYASRNFDPFNLLSIPIPAVADVLFQCTVYRRATAKNCPWVLGKVRKGDMRASRYDVDVPNGENGPPSVHFIAEQYVIALSRLADSGDLRLQIQNLSGIRANQLRLCRTEEVVVNKDVNDGSVVKTQMKLFPLSDKDGPTSQHAKKRDPNDENGGRVPPIQIIAFEMTLNPRILDSYKGTENNDDEEEDEQAGEDFLPSPKTAALIESHLEVYGDDLECRMVDTDSLVIAKAVSRSLWPRSEDELKLGLRVDAMDHRGNWFPGSVIEILDDKLNGSVSSGDGDEAVPSSSTKRVRVHFDNFSPKWDEMYSIEHLKQGRVRPLYSHAVPKRKPTEFLVYHRHTDRQTGQLNVFGQSFYVQCQNEWSNARAGAHILAQVCRFMQYKPNLNVTDEDRRNAELEAKAHRLYEKTHAAISDLIDLLVDCDREYVRLALGVSQHNNEEERSHPFRNPTFDASILSSALVKKVAGLLQRLPFEVRICTVENAHSHKPCMNAEEVLFPFSLVRTIGNFMNIRHAVFLQWREPSVSDKKQPGSSGASSVSYRSCLKSPVMYVEPSIQIHEASASLINDDDRDSNRKKKNAANGPAVGGSAGIDLSYCLTEFCKVQKLSISDNWKCPVCKVFREGGQNMNLWRLPDLLTFHIKRFNMSARWHEKITTKVNFPLTGLDMSQFCHKESPVFQEDTEDSYIYDLIGVMNHYGSMTGGHYVATCKATPCGRDGREEVAYTFNGLGTSSCVNTDADEADGSGASASVSSGGTWRLGRPKQEVVNPGKVAATMASKHVSESAEPLWLQFDDEVVEPIPPTYVVSEMAYVLFYRRRRISPSNIAKYSTLE